MDEGFLYYLKEINKSIYDQIAPIGVYQEHAFINIINENRYLTIGFRSKRWDEIDIIYFIKKINDGCMLYITMKRNTKKKFTSVKNALKYLCQHKKINCATELFEFDIQGLC